MDSVQKYLLFRHFNLQSHLISSRLYQDRLGFFRPTEDLLLFYRLTAYLLDSHHLTDDRHALPPYFD